MLQLVSSIDAEGRALLRNVRAPFGGGVAGAQALRAMMEGGDAIATKFQDRDGSREDADNATREVLIAVRRTFITPFDRGNIRDLITSMDNGIDQMQKTAKTIQLFEVKEFTPQMKEMADEIVKCAKLVQEAVPLLQLDQQRSVRISSLTAQISALEGKPTNCTTSA